MPNIESKTVATRYGQGRGSGQEFAGRHRHARRSCPRSRILGQPPLSLNKACGKMGHFLVSGQPRPVFAERHGTSDRLTMPAGTLHLEQNRNAHRQSTQVQ